MFKRDWLHYALPVLVALGLLGLAYCTQPSGLRITERNAEESCTQKAYRIENDADGQPFLSVVTEPKPCGQENAAAEYSENGLYPPRDSTEADLLAQKKMAHWTAWIGGFTAVGLAVLYITFYATRQAVSETRKIGEAQSRAYLAVVGGKFWYAANNWTELKFVLEVHNSGHSPAKQIKLDLSVSVDWIDEGPIIEVLRQDLDILNINEIGGQTTLPREGGIRGNVLDAIETLRDRGGELLIVGTLTYVDVFEGRTTHELGVIGRIDSPIPDDKLRIGGTLKPCHPNRAQYEERGC